MLPSTDGGRSAITMRLPNIISTSRSAGTGISLAADDVPGAMIVTRSQSCSISSSLCDTKITISPSAARRRRMSKSLSRCDAEIPVVGSSRISTRAPSQSSRAISSCCRSPTDSAAGHGVGVEREPVALGRGGELLASTAAVEAERAGTGEQEVVEHRERTEHERVLVKHADAGGDRVAWRRQRQRLAVEHDLAVVRPDEPGQHLHQRRLAGTVLAEQAVQLAGGDVEVDGVVGTQRRRSAW